MDAALTPPTAAPAFDPKMQLVLVEDDPGDATLVRDMLDEVEPDLSVHWVRSIGEAVDVLSPDTRCVLLDLVLPDASGFDGLERVLAAAPRAAVIVLTGFSDSAKGSEAVSRGAQDYLNKSQVDPELLGRAVRYAIERRAAQDTARELAQAEARAAENTRLERGLLPTPLLHDGSVEVLQSYRPGRDRALLGGDFYDIVQCEDGSLFAMIGDVSGHGPDEAALGVCLRVAWRTLVLAGTDEDRILPLTAEVLIHERSAEEVFATACMVCITPDRRSARVYLAGHPAPVPLGGAPVELPVGAPLGVLEGEHWTPGDLALDPGWRLMLFTDGLIEGLTGSDGERLGVEGLKTLLADARAGERPPAEWLTALLDRVRELNRGALADDLAVLVLSECADDGAPQGAP
ncbi:PP2C family protein-serine/threonine phosphatase [Sporichthya polymorpha]|uniref:PP2C family protein-serine/threonine phosphatase n=1 Tax=Sporichthya polymorpha TaxID=35751 RepID=UPI000363C887|nr:response regulator [Sporichthya polymorpha]